MTRYTTTLYYSEFATIIRHAIQMHAHEKRVNEKCARNGIPIHRSLQMVTTANSCLNSIVLENSLVISISEYPYLWCLNSKSTKHRTSSERECQVRCYILDIFGISTVSNLSKYDCDSYFSLIVPQRCIIMYRTLNAGLKLVVIFYFIYIHIVQSWFDLTCGNSI